MRWPNDRSSSLISSRRVWLGACGAGLATWICASRAPGQEVTGAGPNWPSRLFEVTPRAGERRLPVVTAISVRPNEPMFATGGDDHHVYLWDAQEGCVLDRLEKHRDWIQSLAFSPDGSLLASAANDGRVIFWNVSERRPVHEFADARHAITQVAWSHDGRWIAGVGFQDCLRIYDFQAKQLARVLKCPDRDMRTLAVSPDDKWLAAAGRNGVIRLWQLPEGSHVLDLRPHHRRIRALNFSPDGAYLVSAGEDRWLHVHPLEGDETGFDLPTPPTKTLCATFYGPQHLATGGSDNLIHLWDIAAGRRLGALAGHLGSVAALDTTTSLLVSGSFDTTVRLWTIVPNLAKKPPAHSPETIRR